MKIFGFEIQINADDDRVVVEVPGISFSDAWSNAVIFAQSFKGMIDGVNGAIVCGGWEISQ